jgi:hypothetical protein
MYDTRKTRSNFENVILASYQSFPYSLFFFASVFFASVFFASDGDNATDVADCELACVRMIEQPVCDPQSTGLMRHLR